MLNLRRQLLQLLFLSSTAPIIVGSCVSGRVSLPSTPVSSNLEHPQGAASRQPPLQLEAAPVVRGLQLTYTIANELMDGSGTMLRIRATLTNVGSVPRHLAVSRIEESDRKGAGLPS